MESIRKFLIRCSDQVLGATVVLLLTLCLVILTVYAQMGTTVLGLILIAVSMWIRIRNRELLQGISFFLLGVAIYFFPAAAISAFFYVGDTFRVRTGMWKSLFIPAGVYVGAIPMIRCTEQAGYPVHRLLAWLNVDNLFDHNISFWSLVTGREQLRFGLVAVAISFSLLILGIFFYVTNRLESEFFMIWSAWTCLLFLPYGHAEDGLVLIILFFFCKEKFERNRIYRWSMVLWLLESLLMIGSSYGGYERFGYDFYQMSVGANFILWLLFSYKGTNCLWKKDQNTAGT